MEAGANETPKAGRPGDPLGTRVLEVLSRIRDRAAATGVARIGDAEIRAEVDAVRGQPRGARRSAPRRRA